MQATTLNQTAIATAPASDRRQNDYDDTFTALFETHHKKIFAFIYSRVREVELAKDLVSQVFEKAYTKGHEVRDPEAYSAWLFMVARNAINGHFRKIEREHKYTEKAGDELRFVDGPPQPEDALLRDERVGQLIKHVADLPKRDRELISLKFDAELTNAEIGQVMGMSGLNVRVALFRALNKLRKRMEAEDSALEAASLAEAA